MSENEIALELTKLLAQGKPGLKVRHLSFAYAKFLQLEKRLKTADSPEALSEIVSELLAAISGAPTMELP